MTDRGRPTLYSKELEKEICIHALEGMSMRQIAKLPGMPSFRTLLRWTKRYPCFGQTLRECLWIGYTESAIDRPNERHPDLVGYY
ncbi:hypothetical protein IRW27_004407 [Escherichia coli]|nr:hypothetical protein [Escherichia coli]